MRRTAPVQWLHRDRQAAINQRSESHFRYIRGVHSSPLSTLLLIFAVAVLTPIVVDLPKKVRVPAVVLELVLGIVIGPMVLGWAERGEIVEVLAEFGLAFLIFLAGFELDFAQMKGAPLRFASQTWVASLVLGLGAGYAMASSGLTIWWLVVGLALTTTALGTLLPILRDAGQLTTDVGRHVLANGAVGEFGPILAIALVLGSKSPARSLVTLVAFAVVAAVAVWLSSRPVPERLSHLAQRTLSTSGQLPVRIAILMVTALVWWASKLELDILLGAFAAGIVFRTFSESAHDHEHLKIIESKLDAVGFGFLIPLFFVVSGMKFDLDALSHDASAIAKVPLFLVLMLVVRGVPVMVLYRKALTAASRRAVALMTSAGLPLVVVITTIGVDSGRMKPANAAALVGAGMLSVLVFPLVGLAQLKREAPETQAADAAR